MRTALALRFLLTFSMSALLCLSPARAQSQLSAPDQQFMAAAAAYSVTQVRAGLLSAERSVDPDTADFGLNMVKDHNAILADLRDFARGRQIALPNEPNRTQQAIIDRLSRLTGAPFDVAYARELGVASLKDIIVLYNKAATTSKDADVKRFAGDWMNQLNNDWQMARGLRLALPKAPPAKK